METSTVNRQQNSVSNVINIIYHEVSYDINKRLIILRKTLNLLNDLSQWIDWAGVTSLSLAQLTPG